jgi:RNA polymerase sigma-70 factor (ECF subfamily)
MFSLVVTIIGVASVVRRLSVGAGTMSHPGALRVVQCMIAGRARAPLALGRKDEGRERRARVAVTPFAQVYEANAAAVYRYCLAQLGDACAAEDAAADAFGQAYAAWATFEDEDPDGARRWIFRIARNASIDQHRRRRRRSLLLGRLGGVAAVDVETVAALREELRGVLSAVGALGRRDRELVALRVAAGLSYAEVGELVGISEQAARTATHRALQRVRAAARTEDGR